VTALATREANTTLDARAERVIKDLRLIIELRDWVDERLTVAPDLSSLHPNLTAAAIESNRDDLTRWRAMFTESLEDYQELLDMSPAEWVSLHKADIVGLEGMIRQATSGIIAWV